MNPGPSGAKLKAAGKKKAQSSRARLCVDGAKVLAPACCLVVCGAPFVFLVLGRVHQRAGRA